MDLVSWLGSEMSYGVWGGNEIFFSVGRGRKKICLLNVGNFFKSTVCRSLMFLYAMLDASRFQRISVTEREERGTGCSAEHNAAFTSGEQEWFSDMNGSLEGS